MNVPWWIVVCAFFFVSTWVSLLDIFIFNFLFLTGIGVNHNGGNVRNLRWEITKWGLICCENCKYMLMYKKIYSKNVITDSEKKEGSGNSDNFCLILKLKFSRFQHFKVRVRAVRRRLMKSYRQLSWIFTFSILDELLRILSSDRNLTKAMRVSRPFF